MLRERKILACVAEDFAVRNTEIMYVFISKKTIENRMNRKKLQFKL